MRMFHCAIDFYRRVLSILCSCSSYLFTFMALYILGSHSSYIRYRDIAQSHAAVCSKLNGDDDDDEIYIIAFISVWLKTD